MLFNPDISKQAVEIIFSNKTKTSTHDPLVFNNIPVKLVEETKHIGLILDNKLSFFSHINDKLAKAKRRLGTMKQLKKYVSYSVLENVYKLYIRPHFDYGDVVYHTTDINIDRTSPFTFETNSLIGSKIESIQYTAARIITGAWKGTSRKKLYENLGWESLHDRRTARRLTILYETIDTKFPNYLFDIAKVQFFQKIHEALTKRF